MDKNIGTIDRIIRALITAGLFYMAWAYYGQSLLITVIATILGIGFLYTVISGSCSVYKLLGISTAKNSQ